MCALHAMQRVLKGRRPRPHYLECGLRPAGVTTARVREELV
jgi:hypothetical protein